MDPRTARTRAALHTAVLELAADRPVQSLSVAEVTRLARVNRATFYDHATSPTDLLRSILTDDLDAARAEFLAETAHPAAESHQRVLRRAAEHVERFAAVYTHAGSSGPIIALLADHLTDSLATFLHRHPQARPVAEPDPLTPAAIHTYARAAALGLVGVLECWLATPSPREPAFVPHFGALVLPEWWAQFSRSPQ